jgi:probable HAF family extracellular repeat protein
MTIASKAFRPRGDAAAVAVVSGASLLGFVVLALAIGLTTTEASAQAMYRMKPLGYLGACRAAVAVATDFNNANQATGQACNANGDLHAFVWRNDGKPMVDLGPAEVGSTSVGYAINATGLAAGTAEDSTGQYGFVSLGDGKPMTRIYNGFGGIYTRAYAVNASGQVTGRADNAPPDDYTSDAFLWKAGTPMLSLDAGNLNELGYPYSWGVAINASGQVAVNAANGSGSYQAFVWKNDGSPLLDLGDLGGYRTFACCINASGQVAGDSSVSAYAHPHAFLWSNDGTAMHDLGTLARGSLSGANALNDSGQVAGWSHTAFYKKQHAFVWMNDGMPMKDLGTFGGTTSLASDINASGQVTGWASLTGDSVTHAFLWRNDGTTKKDLNSLIDPTDPLKAHVTLTRGVFINDSGNVLADGTDSRTGLSGLYFLQGTVITLSPRSLAFGDQRINTASAAKSVTVTNTGSKAVAITSIALSGTASSQFAFTDTCGKSLAGHATCAIKVTFKPTSKGAKSALLNVNGGGGGLRSVKLSGSGI